MKIDGNKFMEWLHKIREEKRRKANRAGAEFTQNRDMEIVREILRRYKIPIVKI